MQKRELVKEWIEFAEMDYQTANYLNENMRPKPLEIICYHCQQTIEKMLKGVLISCGRRVQKTHDLGVLAEQLKEFSEIPEDYLEMCDDLTPYGVRIRYPQELFIEEHHVEKALEETKKLYDWLSQLYATHSRNGE